MTITHTSTTWFPVAASNVCTTMHCLLFNVLCAREYLWLLSQNKLLEFKLPCQRTEIFFLMCDFWYLTPSLQPLPWTWTLPNKGLWACLYDILGDLAKWFLLRGPLPVPHFFTARHFLLGIISPGTQQGELECRNLWTQAQEQAR